MTNLPTGTVTFLFTDIEGSTKLWERYPGAMKAALACHDDILRQAIESNGGYVFKTVGDSFCAAFAAAPEALTAALAAQRALHAQDWGEVGSVRVRVALHTGAAEERGGDYSGPAINRILALIYAGHGGQILLSSAIQGQIHHYLPPGAQLRDLGERRLKDLASPEHIFQVIAPDLPADFPPLRTLDARPTNLPAQPTALIGRELEVAAACSFLRRADVRLLTLTGPSGAGKTRLGLQMAADLLEEFEDGVFFVPLSPIRDANLVPFATAQALDIRETAGRPLLECLKSYLSGKQVLLVLDNFEQVLEAASLVTDLLAAAPRLKVVVTSRAVLNVLGEHRFLVPPLALPKLGRLPPVSVLSHYAAIALFVERARAVRPDFSLTEENALAVVKICARLDRLPLAIELAAARCKLLSPQAMLERLDHRLALLTSGARDLPARQQTMRGAIAWSYDLLDEDEKILFRRISVFAGGCTLAALEAVCADSEDEKGANEIRSSPSSSAHAFDILKGLSLVDKSMLRQEEMASGELRFTMLETIREYALERLAASGEEEALRRRHARFFLDLARAAERELPGPNRAAWLERLEAEHDNLSAALEWSQTAAGESEICLRLAGALRWFWYLGGYWSEGREWLERALALPGTWRTRTRAKVLYSAGELARLQGDRALALSRLEESLTVWRELGSKRGAAYTLTALGEMSVGRNDRDAARLLFAESAALFRDLDDKRGLAYALRGMGTAAQPGDYATARSFFEESLSLFRKVGDRWGLATPLGNLGFLAYQQGDCATASALYEESLAILREVGDKWFIADALNVLGEIARYQEDYQRAEMLYTESLALDRLLGSKRGAATLCHNLAYVTLHQGDTLRAAALFDESLKLERELGRESGTVYCLAGLAAIAVVKGQSSSSALRSEHFTRAARLLGAAQAQFKALGVFVDPADRIEHERVLDAVRAELGEQAFAAAWAEGQAMTLEQAIHV